MFGRIILAVWVMFADFDPQCERNTSERSETLFVTTAVPPGF